MYFSIVFIHGSVDISPYDLSHLFKVQSLLDHKTFEIPIMYSLEYMSAYEMLLNTFMYIEE